MNHNNVTRKDMRKFKIGDLVTPDPDKLTKHSVLYYHVGEVFKVSDVAANGGIRVNGGTKSIRWRTVHEHWKLAKNEIVKKIIKDL